MAENDYMSQEVADQQNHEVTGESSRVYLGDTCFMQRSLRQTTSCLVSKFQFGKTPCRNFVSRPGFRMKFRVSRNGVSNMGFSNWSLGTREPPRMERGVALQQVQLLWPCLWWAAAFVAETGDFEAVAVHAEAVFAGDFRENVPDL